MILRQYAARRTAPVFRDRRIAGLVLAGIAATTGAAAARAATIDTVVDAQAGPWSQAINPSFDYGLHDNSAPTIVHGLTGGEQVSISYVSGVTTDIGGLPPVGANGYAGFGSAFTDPVLGHYPGYYTTSPASANLGALVGTFATSSGQIVGTPFLIGNGPLTVTDPAGATQLMLGLNDNLYADNSGALTVAVTAKSLGAQTPVSSRSGPWSTATNPSFNYGFHDNQGPTVVKGLTSGDRIRVKYKSGLTSTIGGLPPTDANGYAALNINSAFVDTVLGNYPGFYTAHPGTVYLGELIGTFADSAGNIVGTPFAIDDDQLDLVDPPGATQLLIGLNDNLYEDNTGDLSIDVTVTQDTTIAEPQTLLLLAAGLGGIGVVRRRQFAPA
jgi:hypothetical protein